MNESNSKNEYEHDQEIAQMIARNSAFVKPSEASLHKLLKSIPEKKVIVKSPYFPARTRFFSLQHMMAPVFLLVLIVSSGTIYFFVSEKHSSIGSNHALTYNSAVTVNPIENSPVASYSDIDKQLAEIDSKMPLRVAAQTTATQPSYSAGIPSTTANYSAAPSQALSGGSPSSGGGFAPQNIDKFFEVVRLMNITNGELQKYIENARASGKDMLHEEQVYKDISSHLNAAQSLELTIKSARDADRAVVELITAQKLQGELLRELKAL